MWLKVGENKYIYITEITLKNIPFQNGGQNNFVILCNNANLCWLAKNDGVDFFLRQKKRIW